MAGRCQRHNSVNELLWLALSENPARVHESIPRLLQGVPGSDGGAFYLRSNNRMRLAVQWGPLNRRSDFEVQECYALRLVRAHFDNEPGRCPHKDGHLSSACIPVAGNGEIIGLLVIDGELSRPAVARLNTLAEALGAALAVIKHCERLRVLADHDQRLGLFNRNYFETALEAHLSRATFDNKSVSLLFIDIDHFKKYNDTHGHAAGDTLLEQVAHMLQRSVRGQDIAARWGGEELAMIMPGADIQTSYKRAEEIRKEMKLLPQAPGRHPVTVSIGIAVFPENAQKGDDLLAAADAALYRAKRGGRDRIELARDLLVCSSPAIERSEERIDVV